MLSCSCLVLPDTNLLSKYTQTPGIPANNASIKRRKIPGAAHIPAGNLLKVKRPLVVFIDKWALDSWYLFVCHRQI